VCVYYDCLTVEMQRIDDVIRLRCRGILGLVRVLPTLAASSCPVVDEVRSVVDAGPFLQNRAELTEVQERMLTFIEESDGHDNCLPDYLQCRVAGAAVMLAGEIPDLRPSSIRVFDDLREAWANCDFIVERSEAWRQPPFREIKTTLVGVEMQWQENDSLVLESATDISAAFGDRLKSSMEPRRYALRQTIAERIAQLAQW
jgi:hypothetical protein